VQLIAWSIPVFMLAMALEYVLARRRRLDVYRLAPALSDVSCGISQQVFNLVTATAILAIYLVVYQYRLVELDPRAATTWIAGMLAVDFIYYWWHRASHECNLLWAAHVVHHQSEEYNLAVALRQALLTGATLTVFTLPLALLGLPPAVYLACKALNALYQFWIHTELIGKLGPAESILNTPSHHRVHHAVNEQYLDRNYGGILIIWDRLFGSFEPEVARPVYGTVTPLCSFNPLWANFAYFKDIAARIRESTRLRDKLWAVLAHPAWRPGGHAAPPTADQLAARAAVRFDATPSPGVQRYAAVQLLLLVPLTMWVLIVAGTWPRSLAVLAAAALGLGTVALLGLVERRAWAWPLEVVRLAATVFVLSAATGRLG
jgi:alkylglycerol monooxygenase